MLSTAGDRLYMMAMLWLTLQLTGSTTAMAAVSLSESIPLALAGLVGGVLIDRWDRLRTLVTVDLLRSVLVLVIPLAYVTGHAQPWVLVAVGMGMGALGALFDPAMQAALPALVPEREFPALAGLMDTPSRLARLLGPGMAGVLLAVLPAVHFFTLDAVSFAASAASLLLVARLASAPRTAVKPATPPARPLAETLRDGWRAIRRNRPLLAILAMDALGNLGFPAYTLGGLLLATRNFGLDVAGYGLLLAAYGLGSMGGNMAAGNLDLARWRAPLAVGGWAGIGLGFALLSRSPSLAPAVASVALAGLSGALAHVSRAAYIGEAMPREHLGKVHSLKHILTTCTAALGTLAVGWALDRVAPDTVIGVAGLSLIAASAAMLAWLRR